MSFLDVLKDYLIHLQDIDEMVNNFEFVLYIDVYRDDCNIVIDYLFIKTLELINWDQNLVAIYDLIDKVLNLLDEFNFVTLFNVDFNLNSNELYVSKIVNELNQD